MKAALHIFLKDARRLWPAVAITLALLALMAGTDRARADSLVGSTEGWLNLLLPVAWACLLAFAVLEEPLIGDRHFWLTRPYHWTKLLGAKLLFAVAFIHLPSLAAGLYIALGRGFSPGECLPHLIVQQMMFLAAITLPAIALASMSARFAHFITLLFAVALGAVIATGGFFRTLPDKQRPTDYLRPDLVIAIAALGAISVVLLQYRRRRLAMAGGVAVITGLMAGGLFGYAPDNFEDRVRAVFRPGAPLSLRITGNGVGRTNFGPLPSNRDTIAMPVAVSGLPKDALYYYGPIELTIEAPDGSRYRSSSGEPNLPSSFVPVDARLMRFPSDLESAPLSLFIHLSHPVYAKLGTQRLRITGRIPVTFWRLGATAWMPVPGRVNASEVGHCSTTVGSDRWGVNRALNVLCESPSSLPRITRVGVSIAGAVRPWTDTLGDSASLTGGPHWAWLSPLDRGKALLPASDPRTRKYTYIMDVPLDKLDVTRIGVTPQIPTGYTVMAFDFHDVSLAGFYLDPMAPR